MREKKMENEEGGYVLRSKGQVLGLDQRLTLSVGKRKLPRRQINIETRVSEPLNHCLLAFGSVGFSYLRIFLDQTESDRYYPQISKFPNPNT